MKKVITTVGTSLFENYKENHEDGIIDYYDHIKEKSHEEWERWEERVKRIKRPVKKWAFQNFDACAEIKSLVKLQKVLKDDLDVYLIATDTVVSRLAAEIIKDVLEGKEKINIHFNKDKDVIKGLQVKDYKYFVRTGVHEFVEKINDIISDSYLGDRDIVFNISGGYKGLIPFMTIMAQINNCDIVYIYEDSEELIKIPKSPIKIDDELFDRYYEQIQLLDVGIENYKAVRENNYKAFNELEERGFVQMLDDGALLSPIGQIFFSRYKNQFAVFYCTDEVWKEIQEQKDIQRILAEKFFKKDIRKSKTEIKGDHYVYDDGNNNNRIYYFEESGNIYIYKTFENEEAAKAFIKTDPYKERDKIIRNSTLRKWRVNNV